MKKINPKELTNLVIRNIERPCGRPCLIITSTTPRVTDLFREIKAGLRTGSIVSSDDVTVKISDRDIYLYEWYGKFDRFQEGLEKAGQGEPVFLLIFPSDLDKIPSDFTEKCEIHEVTFRDSVIPALSAFLDKADPGLWDKYIDEVWMRISDRWEDMSRELSLDIVSFKTNGTTYNIYLKRRECCVFSDEEGWKDWYERQLSTPMKEIKKYNNYDNLPELPVKKVSAFPSVEDRIAIVKEQLIMAAIEKTQMTRCNADAIKDALFKYFNISSYTVCESSIDA